MPPIRSQSVVLVDANTVQITLDNVLFGLLVITISKSANSYTLTATRDGVTITPQAGSQNPQTFNNPSVSDIETWCQATFGGVLDIKAGGITINTMQFRLKLISLNPFDARIMTANWDAIIPLEWW